MLIQSAIDDDFGPEGGDGNDFINRTRFRIRSRATAGNDYQIYGGFGTETHRRVYRLAKK